MSRLLRYSVLIASVLGCVALIALAISLSDPRFFDRYFASLLVVNSAVAVILLLIVIGMGLRLARHFRQRQYGSHMTTRLAVTITLISVIPTATVYFVSAAFINRAFRDSMDQTVSAALDSGIQITQSVLTRQKQNTEELARQFAISLAGTPDSLLMTELLQLLEDHPGTEALIVTGTGAAVTAAGSRINVLMPDLPSVMQIKTAKTNGIYSIIDGDTLFDNPDPGAEAKNDLRTRVIVPIEQKVPAYTPSNLTSSGLGLSTGRQQLFLQLTQAVQEGLASQAASLVNGYREYQQTIYTRESMSKLYALTLTLTLLLAVFSGIAAALSFARRATAPLMQLEEGTRRVASGDFMPIREFIGNDELNVLTRSFNAMIKDLDDTRNGLERQRVQAQQAQAFLERVLGNISSGVIVVDSAFTVVTANAAARRIIGEDAAATGNSLAESIPELVSTLHDKQKLISEGSETIQIEFELNRDGVTIPLYIRNSAMQLGSVPGSVLVFDDVSQLIKAQRATAWGEVARRLAHEIKNPLTPIRLSAERLEWKLENRLEDPKDLELLHKTIETIVVQVEALKQMVNDFREYARLPNAVLQPLNINEFLENTLALYRHAGSRIVFYPDPSASQIDGDPAQLRQVIHNLISNCLEAGLEDIPVEITVRTQAIGIEKTQQKPHAVKLSISDNGPGFTEKILQSAFEPYVTTKPTGTGLGLPMVKKILDEHGANITMKNIVDNFDGEDAVVGAQTDIIFKASRTHSNYKPVEKTK